jgi:hypothetical protein
LLVWSYSIEIPFDIVYPPKPVRPGELANPPLTGKAVAFDALESIEIRNSSLATLIEKVSHWRLPSGA